jgi:hypothetical protein
MLSMELARISTQPRAKALGQVKFMMLPLPVEVECEPQPALEGSFFRFISRVIGRLVAARP